MKISNLMVFVKAAFPILVAFLFVACSEEKTEPLPDLPAIELPKDVPGLYSGTMPCDDCTMKVVKLTLNADSTADALLTIVKESTKIDSLKGTYVVSSDSSLKVTLPAAVGTSDSVHWNYRRSKSRNLIFMNSAGGIYEDKDGNRFELIRIFKAPSTEVK